MFYSWHMYYLSLVCLFIINLCFIIDNDVVLLLIRRLGKAVLWCFEDTWCFSDGFSGGSGEPGWVIFLPSLWIGDTEAREGQSLLIHSSCLGDAGKARWRDQGNGPSGSMPWADGGAKCMGCGRRLMLDLPIKPPSAPARPRLRHPGSPWSRPCLACTECLPALCYVLPKSRFLFLPETQPDYISQPPLQFGRVMWLKPGRGIWLPGRASRNLCHPPHPLSVSAAWWIQRRMKPEDGKNLAIWMTRWYGMSFYSPQQWYEWEIKCYCVNYKRLEYWSGLPFPSPGDLPNPGIEPGSPALQADSLLAEPPGKPKNTGVGSLSLLQRIFLTQESNWGLLHCRWIL